MPIPTEQGHEDADDYTYPPACAEGAGEHLVEETSLFVKDLLKPSISMDLEILPDVPFIQKRPDERNHKGYDDYCY